MTQFFSAYIQISYEISNQLHNIRQVFEFDRTKSINWIIYIFNQLSIQQRDLHCMFVQLATFATGDHQVT